MFYIFNDDVFLVKGKVYSCIYDFNSCNLYRINSTVSELLSRINYNGVLVGTLSREEEKFVDELINKKLISTSTKRKVNDIKDLSENDKKINFAWIEITKKCNLKCIHCYNESDSLCDKEMTLSDYKEVVDSLIKLDVRKVQIIGGEPFVNKKLLKDMLDYTVGKFDFIEIFTNGTLITEDWIKYLKKNNIKIALSVYSYENAEHDKITTIENSLEKTNSTIYKLNQAGITYRVANILMKGLNIGDKNTELYTLSSRKDIVRMSGRASLNLLSRKLVQQKLITKRTFEIPLKKYLSQRIVSGHNCFKSKLYIDVNKEVYPCVMERRISHCKIEEGKIELDENILNFDKDIISECKLCEFRYTCFDCRPDSLSNNIYEKPWYCTYNPEKGQWLDIEEFINDLQLND